MDEEKKRRKKAGRPSKMTAETIAKIEQAYSIGANDLEAACFADIHPTTLYRYLKDNPDFSLRRDTLKKKPVLKALHNVSEALTNGDEIMTRWYLERRKKDEYSLTHEIKVDADLSGLTIDDRKDALHNYLMSFKPSDSQPNE